MDNTNFIDPNKQDNDQPTVVRDPYVGIPVDAPDGVPGFRSIKPREEVEPVNRQTVVHLDESIVTNSKDAVNDNLLFANPDAEENTSGVSPDDEDVTEEDVDVDPSYVVTPDDELNDLSLHVVGGSRDSISKKILKIGGGEKERSELYMSGDIELRRLVAALRSCTEATEEMSEVLRRMDMSKLSAQVGNIVDASASVNAKFKESNRYELKSADARIMVNAFSPGGIRRVYLWNSGFYVSLKALPICDINNLIREFDDTIYEYGRAYGEYYYAFADLQLKEYIVDKLLPKALVGSSYKYWKDRDKMFKALSAQDLPTICWALGAMQYPRGVKIRYHCDKCGHVHDETVDIMKLRANNTELINDNMIEIMGRTGWVDDERVAEYREACDFERVIEFKAADPSLSTTWKVTMKQADMFSFLDTGATFNAELVTHVRPKEYGAVVDYLRFNGLFRYIPWIKCIEIFDGTGRCVVVNNIVGDKEFENSIRDALDELGQNCIGVEKAFRDYINDTKITHTVFYFPQCVSCGHPTANGNNGYIPYDPISSFFTLALMKIRINLKAQSSENNS